MQTITTIGFDIAKSVFQVHGVDAAGQVVIRRQLKRRHVLAFFQKLPPCLVGIEACASATSKSARIAACHSAPCSVLGRSLPLLALFGRGAMSDLSPLSGAKRKTSARGEYFAFGPIADSEALQNAAVTSYDRN
jgi:hypothetical protein